VSASIRELEGCEYNIGVYDSDPRNSTTAAGAKCMMEFGRFMPNIDNWLHIFGVYTTKTECESLYDCGGQYIGVQDAKTGEYVASCKYMVEEKNAEDFENKFQMQLDYGSRGGH